MSKFIIILLVATFAACINADDNNPFDFLSNGFNNLGPKQLWDDALQIPEQAIDLSENAIKSLPGIPGGQSSGTFNSYSHHREVKNGKVVDDGGSSKRITNDNGTVKEIDSSQ